MSSDDHTEIATVLPEQPEGEPSMPMVLVERSDGVVRVTLNRPEKKNAITSEMWDDLAATFRQIAVCRTDRVLVLTGAGDAFCSGVDFAASGMPRELGGQLEYMRRVGQAALALHEIPKPAIAAVNGAAIGAGCNLALGCDLIVASRTARFSEIFSQRALSPDFGGTWLLPRLVGLHKAKELALLGEVLSADDAREIGIVNRVVEPDDLEREVAAIASRLVGFAPIALANTKHMLNHALSSSMAEALELETRSQVINTNTRDAVEAVRAFRDRRAPVFTGE
jgi:enoyl-CoA hydratase/carnithine racemase